MIVFNVVPIYEEKMATSTLEQEIAALIDDQGPLTGRQLSEMVPDINPILLWKACYQSNILSVINFARYYLRYDVTRDDMIRLSPSVLRDFLSFTLIHLSGQHSDAVDKAAMLANKHRMISLKKLKFARNTLLSLSPEILEKLHYQACCFIAGDISYFLAHEEPRIHGPTGAKLYGSDIDIIVVHENDMDPDLIQRAEEEVLTYKHRCIKDPVIGQEIDFLFKPVHKMLDQFTYGDIHQKIASKILYESFFLYGRLDLYEKLTTDLDFTGTVKKIEDDFTKALAGRKATIKKILALKPDELEKMDKNTQSLFFFSQERLEFQ